jgi:hypothetical protein
MLGYVQRLDATTLAAATTRNCELKIHEYRLTGTSAIMARVADGLLWVTQPTGRPAARNYCADPSDGRPLARVGVA